MHGVLCVKASFFEEMPSTIVVFIYLKASTTLLRCCFPLGGTDSVGISGVFSAPWWLTAAAESAPPPSMSLNQGGLFSIIFSFIFGIFYLNDTFIFRR